MNNVILILPPPPLSPFLLFSPLLLFLLFLSPLLFSLLQDDNPLVPLAITNGEIKAPGDIDLAHSMRRWKWAELSSTTAGLSSLTDQ